jgi:hypothetical protein
VLDELVERFVCVPGIGRKETGLVSNLDTPEFSVFWDGGAIRRVKIFRARIRMWSAEKSMGIAPHVLWWAWGRVARRPVLPLKAESQYYRTLHSVLALFAPPSINFVRVSS